VFRFYAQTSWFEDKLIYAVPVFHTCKYYFLLNFAYITFSYVENCELVKIIFIAALPDVDNDGLDFVHRGLQSFPLRASRHAAWPAFIVFYCKS